jgi:hypothetical protein
MLFVNFIRSDFKHLHLIDQVKHLIFRFVLQCRLPHSHLLHKMAHVVAYLRIVFLAAVVPAAAELPAPGSSGPLFLVEGRGLYKVAAAFASENAMGRALVEGGGGGVADPGGSHRVTRLVSNHALTHTEVS